MSDLTSAAALPDERPGMIERTGKAIPAFLVTWSLFLVGWVALGIPLGF